MKDCEVCNGSGVDPVPDSAYNSFDGCWEPVPQPCMECQGSGKVKSEKEKVRHPDGH
jgi:DnaJ-class molecular chaperone